MSSQKREQEETIELKVPTTEALKTGLCPDNCKISAPTCVGSGSGSGSASSEPVRIDSSNQPPLSAPERRPADAAERRTPDANANARDGGEAASAMKKSVNRCSGCAKRVGLTGFRCRCGELFCSVHRYSDRHDCSYDYKTAGREAIARDNPMVRASKILKI